MIILVAPEMTQVRMTQNYLKTEDWYHTNFIRKVIITLLFVSVIILRPLHLLIYIAAQARNEKSGMRHLVKRTRSSEGACMRAAPTCELDNLQTHNMTFIALSRAANEMREPDIRHVACMLFAAAAAAGRSVST
jgi:hypothetical protein